MYKIKNYTLFYTFIHTFIHIQNIPKHAQYPQIYTIFPTIYHLLLDCSALRPTLPHSIHFLITTNNITISNNTNYIPILPQHTNTTNYITNCNIIQSIPTSPISSYTFPKHTISHYTTIYSTQSSQYHQKYTIYCMP